MKKIVVAFLTLALVLSLCGCGSSGKYEKACQLLEQGEFAEAKTIFVELGDYEDSAEKAKECDYEAACQLKDKEEYAEAKAIFETLGDYEDSADQVKACSYQLACQLMEEENYQEAQVAFEELGDYEDSAEKAAECAVIEIDAQLQGDWKDFGFASAGLYTTFVFEDGRMEVHMEIDGKSTKMNEGDYRIDAEEQAIYVTYDQTYSFGSGGVSGNSNTEEQKLFTYTYEDGVLTLASDSFKDLQKQ